MNIKDLVQETKVEAKNQDITKLILKCIKIAEKGFYDKKFPIEQKFRNPNYVEEYHDSGSTNAVFKVICILSEPLIEYFENYPETKITDELLITLIKKLVNDIYPDNRKMYEGWTYGYRCTDESMAIIIRPLLKKLLIELEKEIAQAK